MIRSPQLTSSTDDCSRSIRECSSESAEGAHDELELSINALPSVAISHTSATTATSRTSVKSPSKVHSRVYSSCGSTAAFTEGTRLPLNDKLGCYTVECATEQYEWQAKLSNGELATFMYPSLAHEGGQLSEVHSDTSTVQDSKQSGSSGVQLKWEVQCSPVRERHSSDGGRQQRFAAALAQGEQHLRAELLQLHQGMQHRSTGGSGSGSSSSSRNVHNETLKRHDQSIAVQRSAKLLQLRAFTDAVSVKARASALQYSKLIKRTNVKWTKAARAVQRLSEDELLELEARNSMTAALGDSYEGALLHYKLQSLRTARSISTRQQQQLPVLKKLGSMAAPLRQSNSIADTAAAAAAAAAAMQCDTAGGWGWADTAASDWSIDKLHKKTAFFEQRSRAARLQQVGYVATTNSKSGCTTSSTSASSKAPPQCAPPAPKVSSYVTHYCMQSLTDEERAINAKTAVLQS
jgi:hypothetical protein